MLNQVLAGRYEIQKLLGKNPGRRTFLAFDNQTQELVVVKLLTFSEDFEWQSLKLFEREAEVLKSLNHPAIPDYLDYFEVERGFALVQSYINANSLEEQVTSGRTFNELEVKQIAKVLLEIICYLHGRFPCLIHRDIKPSNILFTEVNESDSTNIDSTNLYLIDFGSVQNAASKPQGTITIVGTYGYMPMEQFGGQTVPASDLYSLGATLIYLVTGRHPTELPKDDGRIAFEEVVSINPQLADWLVLMTEPSLKRRMKSAKIALDMLEQVRLPEEKLNQQPESSSNEDDVSEFIIGLDSIHLLTEPNLETIAKSSKLVSETLEQVEFEEFEEEDLDSQNKESLSQPNPPKPNLHNQREQQNRQNILRWYVDRRNL